MRILSSPFPKEILQKMIKKSPLKNNILLTTALTTSLMGYYRRAEAACSGSGGTYTCSGVNTAASPPITADDATVSTVSGFSIDSPTGSAISITGDGALSFTDTNTSSISANNATGPYGLYITTTGDSAVNDGSITINTNSTINLSEIDPSTRKTQGIRAYQRGSGSATIDVSGNISANYGGISSLNTDESDSVSITTGANSLIDVDNYANTNSKGIYVVNDGTGSTTLDISGDINANKYGIKINNDTTSPDYISLTTRAESLIDVSGANSTYRDSHGLRVINEGIGSVTLDISGDINANYHGIYISNSGEVGSSVSLTTRADSLIDVTGDRSENESRGIYIKNSTGSTDLDIFGDINARYNGIRISHSDDAALSLTTHSTSAITSVDDGLNITHTGNSTTTLTLSGDITTTSDDAIDITATNGATISIINGATISGDIGINSSSTTVLNITLDGSASAVSLTGTGGYAARLGDGNDAVAITGSVTLDGYFDARGGVADTLTLTNSNITLEANSDFLNFDTLVVNGDNTVTGDLDLSATLDVVDPLAPTTTEGGTLRVNGTLTSTALAVVSDLTIAGEHTFTGALTVNSGGAIAPGNSVGTIAATGNVIFETGSNLDVEIDTSGTDLLDVTGNLTIESGTNLNVTSLGFTSGSGTIASADVGSTLDGTFTAINNSGSTVSTVYTSGNNINLITLNTAVLNSQLQSSINSSILFNDTLNDEIANGAFMEECHFWIRNINRNRNVSVSESNVGFRTESNGIALGVQKYINENYKVGLSLSKLSSNNKMKDNLGTKSDDAIFASIYGIYNRDITNNAQLFTSLSLGLGYHDNFSSRAVYNSGVLSYATSAPKDYEYNASLQIGAKIKLKNNYFVMPRASASYVQSFGGGFDESSGGVSAVRVSDYNFSTVKTRESIRLGKEDAANVNFRGRNIKFSPYVELGLSQEKALSSRTLNGQFSTGSNFSTSLEDNNRNFTIASIGTNAQLNDSTSAFINYESSNSNEENRSEIRGGLRIKF
jgi:hypothetical protein